MHHLAYKDVAAFEQAMDKYARLSAQEFFNRGPGYYQKKLGPLNQTVHPVWTFFYRYFVRGGILDGAYGLQLASIYSGYVGNKIKYLRALVSQNKKN